MFVRYCKRTCHVLLKQSNRMNFVGLALGPSLATVALAASWSYVEISLAAAACSSTAALFSALALRNVR